MLASRKNALQAVRNESTTTVRSGRNVSTAPMSVMMAP